MNLPLYQCHKKVRAAKILDVAEDFKHNVLHVEGGELIKVDREWLLRNPKLAIGGYFVQYEDGYTAYSPAGPFESGYTLMPEPKAAASILSVEEVAAVCHEANRAFCEQLGDNSQMPWPLAPDWQRKSAVVGVEFNLANPEAPASASHDSWLAEKERDGWKYGPVKDAEKKEHPCYVPYEQLPKDQQAKDHLFKAVVAALAPLVDTCNGCLGECSICEHQ